MKSLHVEVNVVAKPRSKRASIEIIENGSLIIHVKEPPDKGKANKAIIKLVSKTFGISSSRINIIRGLKSTSKIIRIDDLGEEEFLKILSDLSKDV